MNISFRCKKKGNTGTSSEPQRAGGAVVQRTYLLALTTAVTNPLEYMYIYIERDTYSEA